MTEQFDVQRDAPKLHELSENGIYLGTSSWKYPGWVGQVYHADYSGPRSLIQKKRFEAECLQEFATVFPTVCLDEGFWRFPETDRLEKYAEQVPDNFRFGIKVTNQVTERRTHEGVPNGGYLDSRLFTEHFYIPTRAGLGDKLGPVILEFSPFFFGRPYGQLDYSPLQFVKDLHKFLTEIPKRDLMLAVEIRDPELLAYPRYLDCLEYHGVAHVLNEQTHMPEISEQVDVPGIFPASFAVIRALVRPGVKHNDAVKQFEPYNQTQLELPNMREGIIETVKRSLPQKRKVFGFVNNRTEGNAPNTLATILKAI